MADSDVTFIYTDRHAYLSFAQFYSSLDDLKHINWKILQRRDFKYDPEDPEKKEQYQAEALVHRYLAVEHLTEIVCYGENEKKFLQTQVQKFSKNVAIRVCPDWYF